MLRTERLCLRNFCAADAEALFAYRNDEACNRYQRYDRTDLAYLQEFVRAYANCALLSTEEQQHYAIVRQEDAAVVGDVSVFYTQKDNCFTLGITIAPIFWRQGYAFELLCALVEQLQKRYPTVDIVALIEKDNRQSIGLFKKLGFVEECYAKSIESYVYTIFGKGEKDAH